MELNKEQIDFIKNKYPDEFGNIIKKVIEKIEYTDELTLNNKITESIEKIISNGADLINLIEHYYTNFDLNLLIAYSKHQLFCIVNRIIKFNKNIQ